jgi:simple sugar transport system permease protein
VRPGAWLASRRWTRPLLALVAIGLFDAAATPGFFDVDLVEGRLAGPAVDVLERGSIGVLLALGMTLVVATGGVDLSVGATMAIAGALAATLVEAKGATGPLALLAALAAGIASGIGNGLLVAAARISPIVATLVLMVAGRGVAQLLTGGRIVIFDDPFLRALDHATPLGVPMPVVLAAATATALGALTRRTALGLFVESVGENASAARLTGVPVGAVRLAVYAICGLCAALAGVLAAADIEAADANNAGLYLELDAILAVVFGGTSLRGGRATLLGSALGALFLQALTTTLAVHDVDPSATLVVKAAAVLAICLLPGGRRGGIEKG